MCDDLIVRTRRRAETCASETDAALLRELASCLTDAERERDAARDALREWERWEADLILCDEAWNGGRAALPKLTWQLYDKMLALQAKRNAALKGCGS
jgi:hypothetical protein